MMVIKIQKELFKRFSENHEKMIGIIDRKIDACAVHFACGCQVSPVHVNFFIRVSFTR